MTANDALFSHIESLDKNKQRILIRDIKTVCYLNRDQWWNWKHKRTRIKPIYFSKINEIVGLDLFKDVTI